MPGGTRAFQRLAVTYTEFGGAFLGVIGVIVSIVVAVHGTVIDCPDGTEFAAGDDGICRSYPHAGIGAALAIIALLATIAVGLLGVLVFRALGPGTGPHLLNAHRGTENGSAGSN